MIKALDAVVSSRGRGHRRRHHPRRRARGADPGRGLALRGPARPRREPQPRGGGGLSAMYEQYWGLREKPFRKTPDPRYLFLNETYEEALERLRVRGRGDGAGAAHGRGRLGQDAADARARRPLGERYEVGMILNPRLSPRQFLRTTAAELGVSRAALPRERPARPDPRAPARARRGGARGAADRRRGAPDPRQAHLRGDPPAHELPARRPQPDRDRAGGPAGAARAAAPPHLPRAHAADRRVVRPARRSRPWTRAPTSRTGCRWPARRGRCSATSAIARLHEAAAGVPRVLNQLATQALLEGMARGRDAGGRRRSWRAVAAERDFARPGGARG